MYPHERSLVEEMQNKPFALIGVNSDKNLDKIRQIVKDKKLNWRSFQNKPAGSDTTISTEWNVRGWPTLYVLDENRKIHYVGHSGNAAIKLVHELVAELEKKKKGQ